MTADELIDGWQAAWSGRRQEAFDAICAAGIQYEDPLTDAPLEGLGALGGHAERLWAAFPDVRLERTGQRLSDGTYLAAPCKLAGTHRAPLGSIPATDRFAEVHCVFYCELSHGLLLRVRALFDVYEAAVQLGVLPARGTLGERALLMLRGFGLRASR